MSKILILGSAPSAVVIRDWDVSPFAAIVAINNAWQLTDAWTHHIHPEDFPEERRPSPKGAQQIITYKDYVPAQNEFGGFVYAGGTMAFTAAYWALHALAPRELCFLGCDMVYPKEGQTHFYGTGTADPLRDDPTLMDLRAKALRLEAKAAAQGCDVVNTSSEVSVLPYPRKGEPPRSLDRQAIEAASLREQEVGYMEPSGRYWDNIEHYDRKVLAEIDALWRKVEI